MAVTDKVYIDIKARDHASPVFDDVTDKVEELDYAVNKTSRTFSEADRNISDATKSTGDFKAGLEEIQDESRGVVAGFSEWEDVLGDALSTLKNISTQLIIVGAGITAGIGALIYRGAAYNVQVEQLQKRLLVFLGTQEKVNEAYEWASELTLRVPLSRRDVIPIVTLLEQYGFAYQEWAETIIDVAAATKLPGQSINEQMQRIAIAFGRVKMGQIGIGVRMLEDAGIAVEKAGLLMSKGGQFMDEPRVALEKLKNYIDTQFMGSAEEFGNTWEGLMIKFKSLTDRFLGAGVAPAFEKLQARLVMLTDWMASDEGQRRISEWAATLGNVLDMVIRFGDYLVRRVVPSIMKFLDWFSQLEPEAQAWRLALPLVTGLVIKFTTKIVSASLALADFIGKLKTAGSVAPVAGEAIGGLGGSAAGAIAPFIKLAAVVAAFYVYWKGLDWAMPKLGEQLGAPEGVFEGPTETAKKKIGITATEAMLTRTEMPKPTGPTPVKPAQFFWETPTITKWPSSLTVEATVEAPPGWEPSGFGPIPEADEFLDLLGGLGDEGTGKIEEIKQAAILALDEFELRRREYAEKRRAEAMDRALEDARKLADVAKEYAEEVTAAYRKSFKKILEVDLLKGSGEAIREGIQAGFNAAIFEGESFWGAFADVGKNYLQRMFNTVFDWVMNLFGGLLSGLFGGQGAGQGGFGILGFLGGLFGFQHGAVVEGSKRGVPALVGENFTPEIVGPLNLEGFGFYMSEALRRIPEAFETARAMFSPAEYEMSPVVILEGTHFGDYDIYHATERGRVLAGRIEGPL